MPSPGAGSCGTEGRRQPLRQTSAIGPTRHWIALPLMRGFFLSGGLPTFRGAGGLYQGVAAHQFLSARGHARGPDAVEAWLERLRIAVGVAVPNRAHVALAGYQARYPHTVVCTQNVDTLLERAGARDAVHSRGRLDRLRWLGHGPLVSLGSSTRADGPDWCSWCVSRLRSDVVLS